MKKYFEVQAMCGHVGKGKYIPISFPVIAINRKEAAEKVRSYPRVKHHYKKAILNVWEISFDSYLKLKDANNLDAYLHCNNIQQQRQIENFESRVHYMPAFNEKKYKRTKEYMMYRQQITRLHNIDQERKIQEYYSSALTDNSWNDKPIDSTGDDNNIFA